LKNLKEYFFLFKIHHWVKNLTIFLPLVAGHLIINNSIQEYILHFLNFSILASIIYLLNNINDYKEDQKNKKLRYTINTSKKNYYYFFCTIVLITQISLTFIFDPKVLSIFIIYFILSLTYNFILRNKKYIDIFTISLFHILRIYYGSLAFNIELSPYFISFCLSIFLMIGTNKRLIEINNNFKNRPYENYDKNKIKILQIIFGAMGIFIFFLYCLDPTKNQYFLNQNLVYINLLIIILIIVNFLFFQKNSNQDIVLFIYKNKINFFLATLFFIIFISNSVFFYN
tara:strand:+ start:16 stop:870 length:855 start_codon:yes stop_codon:yes gene_type:complete